MGYDSLSFGSFRMRTSDLFGSDSPPLVSALSDRSRDFSAPPRVFSGEGAVSQRSLYLAPYYGVVS